METNARQNHSLVWKMQGSATLPDTLELYIYSTVESTQWDAEQGKEIPAETSAEHFRQQLAAHPNAKEISIYINSLGGSVMEGVAIYNQLRRHPAHKTVYVDGFACSIASVIAMAGDEVIMPENTVMMIHNAWTCAVGNAAQLRKAADDLEVLNEASRQAYLLKSGGKISEAELQKLLDEETYLTAEQCIAYGFADIYGGKTVDMERAKAMVQSQPTEPVPEATEASTPEEKAEPALSEAAQTIMTYLI